MPETFGPYSPTRQIGNTVYVSGQVGIHPTTRQAADTVALQTQQALENLQTQLNTHGLSLDAVVKTTIFLRNIDDFAAMNAVYENYFQVPRPARSCVAVASLPKITDTDLLVEIEAVADGSQT